MSKDEEKRLREEFFRALDEHSVACFCQDSTPMKIGFTRAAVVAAFEAALDARGHIRRHE